MLTRLAYIFILRAFQLLALLARGDAEKDAGILVLRHDERRNNRLSHAYYDLVQSRPLDDGTDRCTGPKLSRMKEYDYPYMPPDRRLKYVDGSDPIMTATMMHARTHSLDATMPNASTLVHHNQILISAANGSIHHRVYGCARQLHDSATGEDYDLCVGCQPQNHSERRVICLARENNMPTSDADLYLWGHFGCCRDCWSTIIAAGINDVILVRDANILFNKKHPKNIIGKLR